MSRKKRRRLKTPAQALLVDKNGKVHSTHMLYSPDPDAEIIQMNKTATVYTDGRLSWILADDIAGANATEPPSSSQACESNLLKAENVT